MHCDIFQSDNSMKQKTLTPYGVQRNNGPNSQREKARSKYNIEENAREMQSKQPQTTVRSSFSIFSSMNSKLLAPDTGGSSSSVQSSTSTLTSSVLSSIQSSTSTLTSSVQSSTQSSTSTIPSAKSSLSTNRQSLTSTPPLLVHTSPSVEQAEFNFSPVSEEERVKLKKRVSPIDAIMNMTDRVDNFHAKMTDDIAKYLDHEMNVRMQAKDPLAPVVFLQGIHGSGKSYAARQIVKQMQRVPVYMNGLLVDSMTKLREEFQVALYTQNCVMIIEDFDEYDGSDAVLKEMTSWILAATQMPKRAPDNKKRKGDTVFYGTPNPIIITFTDLYGSSVYKLKSSYRPESKSVLCHPLSDQNIRYLIKKYQEQIGIEPSPCTLYDTATKTFTNFGAECRGPRVKDSDRIRVDRFEAYKEIVQPERTLPFQRYKETWDLGGDFLHSDVYGNLTFVDDDRAFLSRQRDGSLYPKTMSAEHVADILDVWSLSDMSLCSASVEQQIETAAMTEEALVRRMHLSVTSEDGRLGPFKMDCDARKAWLMSSGTKANGIPMPTSFMVETLPYLKAWDAHKNDSIKVGRAKDPPASESKKPDAATDIQTDIPSDTPTDLSDPDNFDPLIPPLYTHQTIKDACPYGTFFYEENDKAILSTCKACTIKP